MRNDFAILLAVSLLGLPARAQSAIDLNRQAELAIREEDFIRATSLLRQSLAVNPNYLEANENLALVLFYLGEDGEAERYARQAVRLAGNRGRARLLLARVLLRRGPGAAAEIEQLLQQALREEGPSVELYNTFGALEVVRNRLPLALRYYELSLDRQPNQLQALQASFLIEESQGNVRRAESLLDRMLRNHGVEPAVLELAVDFHHRTARFSLAAELSDRLINLVSEWSYPGAFVRAAQDRAKLDLTRQRLDPGFGLDRSVQLMRTALQRDSTQPLSFALLGDLLFRQNRVEEAQAAYRSALERRKDDEILRLSWERSVRRLPLDNPARLEPARFYAAQAESLMQRNRIDQAREAYRRLLRLDPFDRGARWGLAQAWRELGFSAQYLGGLVDLEALETKVRPDTRRLAEEADRELKRELDYWLGRWYPERTLGGKWRLEWEPYRFWRDPSTWNLNQPGAGGRPSRVAVFLVDRIRHLAGFPEQIDTFLEAFGDLLLSQLSPWPQRGGEGRVGVVPLQLSPVVDQTGEFDPSQARVASLETAIERARRLDADFLLVMDFDDTDGLFVATGELRMGSTGRLVQSISASRRGAERVLPALRDLVQRVHQFLPLRATLAARREMPGQSFALVPLGSLHGLKPGDELLVIKPEALTLQPEFPYLQWPESAHVATVRLTTVDDWMSEGELRSTRGQDLSSLGDSVVHLRQRPEVGPSVPSEPSPLASRVLRIR